ncbi:MAG TPA: AsnC family transcriptional regulator [Acidimicrobiales bacterium]|nr:AsnC family transcriptional regulator [Acidimicrobiales bacterium]
MDAATLDGLDRKIVHALHIGPRAPFRLIGAAVGVSDQTVARRYHALRRRAGLRVIGRIDGRAVGWSNWLLRLQCTPDAAVAVAVALARRHDTSWVRLASGGTEIICAMSAASAEDWDELVLEKLTGSRRIVGINAYSLLHVFAGMTTGWIPAMEALDAEQVALLRRADAPAPSGPMELTPADGVLTSALAREGRATHAELASLTGWHESTVRRRIEALSAAGILYFDVDIDEAAFGVRAAAHLWLSVAPSGLAAVGEGMAADREVAFAAATSGPTNLMASVVCADSSALYRYLSERIGGYEGALRVETSPVVRTLKRAGALSP